MDRETGNIGYTRRGKTKQKQSRETDNIGYTRRRKTSDETQNNVLDTTIRKQTEIT